ncbi:MAG: hypothetical protein U0531_20005 [Dehalococcoidia bacterium]
MADLVTQATADSPLSTAWIAAAMNAPDSTTWASTSFALHSPSRGLSERSIGTGAGASHLLVGLHLRRQIGE